jgi:hypothetical protein
MAGGAAQARLSVRARWHGAADYWARLPRGCSRQQRWEISPLVEGSTAPTKTIDHAGIAKVLRYRFKAPF